VFTFKFIFIHSLLVQLVRVIGTMPNGRDTIDSWGDPNKLNQEAMDKDEFEGEHRPLGIVPMDLPGNPNGRCLESDRRTGSKSLGFVSNPNDLDPVRRSDSKHRPLGLPGKSIGTMPNGRDTPCSRCSPSNSSLSIASWFSLFGSPHESIVSRPLVAISSFGPSWNRMETFEST
jgi:hypothetical protein